MSALADALWARLAGTGVSWIGFYLGPGEAMEDGRVVGANEMLLGPCRDRPACSPIGLHGACGRSWREGVSLVVRDVADLGEGYVACDPRDRSEVVVPLMDDAGRTWGVVDADSFEVGSFTRADADGLARVVVAWGLGAGGGEVVVV